MKKSQTVKDISIEDNNRIEKDKNFTSGDQQTITTSKKLPIPYQHLKLNNKMILTNKNNIKRKHITNILTNDNNTISDINISNPKYLFGDLNASYRSKIYQKKRIPIPHKTNFSKEKEKKSFSIGVKKKFKYNLNISNNRNTTQNYNSFNNEFNLNGKNGNLSHEILYNEPKICYQNRNKNNMSLNNHISNIKKYLYLNYNMNRNTRNNIINISNSYNKKSLSDRRMKNIKKRVHSKNYKKIDLFKINKINNINNININLNNINNISNKIEYEELMKKVNSCRNTKEANFLKKLNFDQPGRIKLLQFSTFIENFSANKTLINNHEEIPHRIKHNSNFIYKNNNHTLNNDININGINYKKNILNKKKILYKIQPKLINPIVLTPRNYPYYNYVKCENKKIYSNVNNSAEYKLKNNNKNKSKNDNQTPKSAYIPNSISSNKKNKNKKLNLFDTSKQYINYINKNKVNTSPGSLNNNDSASKTKDKNIEYDKNIISNDSMTIFNNSNSEITSYMSDLNELTQNESEKDIKKNVLSTYQLNIFLNEAKQSNHKNVNINNNISNIAFNKALLFITNPNKKNINEDGINLYKNKIENKNNNFNRYEYNIHTTKHFVKKLKLNNILFISINEKFKNLLLKFIDKKSLLILSSVNKIFYKNFRKKLYKYFYDKIIRNNGNKDYILKILNSIPKYASQILKSNNPKNLKSKYEFYKKNKSIYNDIILQDIIRTFPNEPCFKVDSINYKKLYNLLTSYSNYNKSIGYAQGLNFLAASSIFLFKNEEKIFIFLDGLINRFKLNHLFSINNQNLPKKLKYFSNLLNKYCDEFTNYLSSKLLSHEFFSTGWILTLFSNSMDRNKLFICWCFMIIFGWKFFYSFVIQLLLFYKKNLLEIKETKLSAQMKEILKGKQFIKDFNKIIENTLTFMSDNIVL